MSKNNIQIRVDGMTCNNCSMGLQRQLEKKGLSEVDVSFSLGEASFVNPNEISKNEILTIISSMGFTGYWNENEEISKYSKVEILFAICLILTLPLFLHMFVSKDSILNNFWLQLSLSTPVFLIGAVHFGRSGFNSLKTGVPNMDVLIFTGTTAAYVYSIWGSIIHWNTHLLHQYLFFETTASIVTLVLLGNVLEKRSVNQTTTALKELLALQKTKAKIILENGDIEEIENQLLVVNQRVLINVGDQFPADGIIQEGDTYADESMISGESEGIHKPINSSVIGGTINLSSSVKMITTAVGNKTILSGIISLVKDAQGSKPEIQKLGDKVAAVFVPVVILISLTTFLISYLAIDLSIQDALMRSIAVLVISCPCAMGLATPTAVMAGIGRAAKSGILIKGGFTLEQLSKVNTFIFDKTGTLSDGDFNISNIQTSNDISEKEFLSIVKSLEKQSSHPIAQSLYEKIKETTLDVVEAKERKGFGVFGQIKQQNYFLGKVHEQYQTKEKGDIHLFKNEQYLGSFDITDHIKEDAAQTIKELNDRDITTTLLSGDSEKKCKQVSEEIGLINYQSRQLPKDKISKIIELQKTGLVAMIGDGINDAPALAQSDVGISFSKASQIAIQQSDIVLLKNNQLLQIVEAKKIADHTMLTIKQNLFWAFFYNVVAIPIAAMGLLIPIYAALAMAFSDVIVIGNSIRLKKKRLS